MRTGVKLLARLLSVAHPDSRWERVLEQLPRKLTEDGLILGRHVREGRFQQALAFVTAGSSLLAGLEVAYEHYRGGFSQKKMYTPLALSPVLMAVSTWAIFDRRASRWALPLASWGLTLDGVLGFYFHVRGIARKPGGWRLPVFNVSMGPPVFAPLLLAMPGYLGLITSYLRREDDPHGRYRPAFRWPHRRLRGWRGQVREGHFQKQMAAAAAISSLLSGAEALYSHYKTRFRFKAQWTPIAIAPALAAAGFAAVGSPRVAKSWLPALSALAVVDGVVGFAYHARGVLRRPGGMKLPLYNLIYGPPVFAPLLFAGAGFLGLLASVLRRGNR